MRLAKESQREAKPLLYNQISLLLDKGKGIKGIGLQIILIIRRKQ